MELLKYVYFCEQKSLIKAGNNKFQDLIDGPRIFVMRFEADTPKCESNTKFTSEKNLKITK